MTIRIDELNPTVIPQRTHRLPAMDDGITVGLTVAQLLGLIERSDLPANVLNQLDLAESALQVVPDKAITNAKLADMAESTLKGRAAGDNTGVPQDLTPAQARAVLRSSWDLLGEASPVASVSSIDFTGLDTTYKGYVLDVQGCLPATNDAVLWLRVGTGAGPTWESGSSGYKWALQAFSSSAGVQAGSSSDSKIVLSNTTGVSNTTSSGWMGQIVVTDPDDSNQQRRINHVGSYERSGILGVTGTGAFASTGAITGLRLLYSTGSIAYAKVTLYGIRGG